MSALAGSRLVAVVFALAAMLSGSLASPIVAQGAGEADLRGTWTWTGRRDGDPVGFELAVTISDQDPSTGAFSGRWPLAGDAKYVTFKGSLKGDRAKATVRDRGGTEIGSWSATVSGTPPTLTMAGTATTYGFRYSFSGTLTDPLAPPVSPQGGDRRSATMVVCDRDMTANTDDAVLECTAQVTDASNEPGSTAPTGSVAWTTRKGTIGPATCTLVHGGGSTSWCAVTLRARAGEIPIGTAPPVTAGYPGDERYGPSKGSPKLYGQAFGYNPTELYGPGCSPASVPYPTVECGDPVNPATGNLVMVAVDLAVGGRGPGMAIARTYNALAAADSRGGRFGVGWSDDLGARIDIGPGKRRTVTLGSGATVPFTADGKRFTAPAWVTASLTRGPRGSFVLTFRDQRVMTFDRDGRLMGISDRIDEPVALAYGPDGTLATVSDASGRTLTFQSDAQGRLTSATDPAGRSVRYEYDAAGSLARVTDVAGGVTSYGYDERHRLVSVTYPNGAEATNAYDDQDRVVTQTDPLGNVMTFAYAGTAPGQVTIATDGAGVRTGWEFRGGLLTSMTRGLGTDAPSRTSYIYDDRHALVATIGPDRGLWLTTRDAAGNLTSSTDPLGRTTTATYDGRNDLMSVTSPMGVTSRATFNDRGLPVRVVHAEGTPDEATVILAYDDPAHPGDLTSVTDPLGAVTTFAYDEHGDVVSRTDAVGGVATASYDVLGQVTATTDPLGATTEFRRDARGDVIAVVDASGHTTTFRYDAVGALTSWTDAAGQRTSLQLDQAGRPVALALADGSTMTAGRDAVGDLVSQTNGLGSTSTTTHDGQSRPVSWSDALGNTWAVAWDPAGRITATTDPDGATTTYHYDAAGQLTGIEYSDGTPPVAYAYDSDGRRVSMTDGTGTSRYTWDARSRLVSVTDGAGRTQTSEWDARGGLRRLTYPNGLVIEHDHDALGRLVAVRDGIGHTNTFEWDANSRLVRLVLGNGTTTERAYDANGWLVAVHTTGPGGSAPFTGSSWQRDAVGRPSAIDEVNAADPIAATYDVRGRLTALGDQEFALDAAGQLTQLRERTLSYDAAGRLEAAAGATATTYAFDRSGRRIAGDGATLSYNAAGQLTGVQMPDSAASTRYTYDGDGLRTTSTGASGDTWSFVWRPSGGDALLLDDGRSRFVYGPGGMPLEQIDEEGTATWLHADPTGSIRALSDPAGTPVATFAWDAYGELVTRTGTKDTRLGFHGQYTDPDTGFHHLQARVYDPRTAQFLTVDPALIATHHPYAFAAGDPLDLADPTGRAPKVVWGKGKGKNVLAGHGAFSAVNGRTTIPEGTTVIFHQPAGSSMTDEYGIMVEKGKPTSYTETYGPGTPIPDYTLGAPVGLHVQKTSTVVTGDMKLSQILKPGMGTVHWAACRAPSGDSYTWVQTDAEGTLRPKGTTVHVGHTKAPIWGVEGPVYEEDFETGMLRDPAWFDWDAGGILPEA